MISCGLPSTAYGKKHQQALLSGFRREKKSLVVAGDGRADSPGHSAKYGCYTLVELTCNKVIDFKLVQVCKHFLVHYRISLPIM